VIDVHVRGNESEWLITITIDYQMPSSERTCSDSMILSHVFDRSTRTQIDKLID